MSARTQRLLEEDVMGPNRRIPSMGRGRIVSVAACALLFVPLAAQPAIAVGTPTALFNPSTATGRNVALSDAGASVVARTDSLGGCWEPYYALNYSNDCGWHTNYGQVTNQWVKFGLAGGDTYLIDRVQTRSRPSCCPDQRVKDFTVAVSRTTTADAAFTTVLSATAASNESLQTFTLPTPAFARYVRFTIVTIYGGACCYASMETLKVLSGQGGGASVTFANLSTDPDNDIVSYSWNFGDGSALSTETNPTHTFPGAGEYQVALTVTDATGGTDTQTLIQRVSSAPTGAVSMSPASPNEGSYATFSASGTDPDGGSIVHRSWTWGDGSGNESGPEASRSHYLRDNLTYNGTVTIVDDEEESATFPFSYTPNNLPPYINVYGDRSIVSGQRLSLGTSVGDPSPYDALTCRWDYGDGTSANPAYCYNLDHRYTLPAGSPALTYTATETVTDDDGASASDSLNVTVLPQIFTGLGNSSLTGLYGVGWSPLANRVVVAWSQTCSTRLSLLGLDGQIQHVGGNIQRTHCNETDMVVSPGRNGFGLGDVFLGNGRPGEIVRVRMDATGAHLGTDNPWVTIPGIACCNALVGAAFDAGGSFGGDLITAWYDGQIFRTNADGTSTRIAHLNRPLQGADIAPATGFGPASGCVLATDYYYDNVWSACANGTTAVVRSIPASHYLESLNVVTSAGDLLITDTDQGTVRRADASAITGALAGHALVTTTYNGEIWDLYYDAPSGTYKTKLFTLAMRSDAGVHIEQTTFVPALLSGKTTLTPATATRAVGSAHGVTASVRDGAGSPIAGLDLTFTVTGANPTTGTATTDANGDATFSYIGSNTGVDQITVGTLGTQSAAVAATWVLRGTMLEVNPVALRVDDAGTASYAELSAHLTDASEAPVVGRTVAFRATDPFSGTPVEVCTAVTDASGEAVCSDPQSVAAGLLGLGYSASFAGDATYAASTGTAPLAFVDRDLP